MKVLFGSGAEHLKKEVSKILDIDLEPVQVRSFPDGEICIRVEASLFNQDIYIIQGTQPPQEKNLMELYQLIEIAKYHKAKQIIVVVPYLSYSRQDKRHHPGEPHSLNIVLQTLALLGATKLVTIDIHNPSIVNYSPIELINLSPVHLFANYIEAKKIQRPLLISPDLGGKKRIAIASEVMGIPYIVLEKNKNSTGLTWYDEGKSLDLEGKNIIILDDLSSSGSTFIPLAKYLMKFYPQHIYYGLTHFFANADQIKEKLGFKAQIFGTNTIMTPWSEISVAPLIANWILENDTKN